MSSSRLRATVAGAAVLFLVAAPAYANQAPNALPDSVTTPEDTAVTVVVTANDSDPDGDTVILALNAVI
ncbi:MAG TPA: Ig-like domain-containing protein, partial [Thermoanaerobaculia bacterium]